MVRHTIRHSVFSRILHSYRVNFLKLKYILGEFTEELSFFICKDLAEQYDNYVAQKAVQAVKPKPAPEPEPEESEEEETIIVKKPKKKIKKKIIFESESEDDEAVVVQKKKPPPQKQPLEKLVYESNKDQLYQRMIEERVKNAVIGYGRALHGY